MQTAKIYYRLTKPGIVYGNLMYAAAGFLLAAGRHIDFLLLLATLGGTSLVIASACVFNNVLDRNIDARMKRTKSRALVTHTLSVKTALVYAAFLGMAGFALLAGFTNASVVLVEAIAFVVYIFAYGWGKRHTEHGTIIGSVSGSAPPVAGYLAANNHFDGAALLLFLILTFWQMPHFYAIATYRMKEYKAAGLPILTVRRGVSAAKKQIVLYILAFIVAVVLLWAYGYTGISYLVVVGAVSLYWLWLSAKGFKTTNDEKWAKQVFVHSLLVSLVFSIMLALNAWLP